MANIVQAPDIQSNMLSDLINNMAVAGISQPPALPNVPQIGDTSQQQPQPTATMPKPAEITPATKNSSVTKTNNDVVTRSIANMGQLVPIPPKADSGSNDDSLKKILSAISGQQAAPQADASAPSSGSSGGGGIGSDISDIASVATAILAWIICTELVRQKRLNIRWYYAGAQTFSSYPRAVKEGYYLWAIPSVAHLRKYPDSLYSRFLSLIFNWRAENIAAHSGVKGARKLWRGAFVTVVLWPVCYLLGLGVIALNRQRDPMQVYGEAK